MDSKELPLLKAPQVVDFSNVGSHTFSKERLADVNITKMCTCYRIKGFKTGVCLDKDLLLS